MYPAIKRTTMIFLAGLVFGLIFVACGGQQQDGPVQAIENYIKLRVASDEAKMIAAACKDWESQARSQAASFKSMNAKLDGMQCSQSGQEGDFTIVKCTGKIVTTYGGESREWPLDKSNYKAIKEDGQWKMCGG